MIVMIIGVIGGVILGALVLMFAGRGILTQGAPPQKPTLLGWLAFALGVFALCVSALGLALPAIATALGWDPSGVPSFPLLSILSAVAAVTAGIGALAKRDRHWPTWVGLVTGAIPVLFWIAFIIAEIVSPHP